MQKKDIMPLQLHPLKLLGNSYNINCKKQFSYEAYFHPLQIRHCFFFAYNMTFGEQGEHRPHRSGGSKERTPMEIFKDTFHGKLAEFAFFNAYTKKYPNRHVSAPDLSVMPRNEWDFTDIRITYDDKEFNIAIKSTKHFANLLLLETKDWDENGMYIPNNIIYDGIVLVRIKSQLAYENFIELKKGKYLLNQQLLDRLFGGNIYHILYEITGFILPEDLIQIIKKPQIIKKGYYLNKKTLIDADNYYIQSGDLRQWSSKPL